MRIKTIPALSLLACVSSFRTEPYMGLQVGTLDYDLPNFENTTSTELFVGYRYSENFAIELNYVDFGESEDGIPPVWTLSGDTVGLVARIIAPLSNQLNLYGRIGQQSRQLEVKAAGYGLLGKDDGTDLFYGVGMNYRRPGIIRRTVAPPPPDRAAP